MNSGHVCIEMRVRGAVDSRLSVVQEPPFQRNAIGVRSGYAAISTLRSFGCAEDMSIPSFAIAATTPRSARSEAISGTLVRHRGNGIRKQRESDVSAAQPLRHYAGTDGGGQQNRHPDRFRYGARWVIPCRVSHWSHTS